jgi:hypothetical protein
MQQLSGTRRRAALLLTAVLLFLTTANVALLAQNLGAAPQTNVAVQGQTAAQPEGAFLNPRELGRQRNRPRRRGPRYRRRPRLLHVRPRRQFRRFWMERQLQLNH